MTEILIHIWFQSVAQSSRIPSGEQIHQLNMLNGEMSVNIQVRSGKKKRKQD